MHCIRGVRCSFRFGFGFTKLTVVLVFGSVFCTVCCLMCMTLEMTYFRNELVQIVVSRSDSEQEVQRYGMKKNQYFDCWSYHAARWIVNETTWKTVPKLPKSDFWKPNRGNRVIGFWILRSVRFLENRYPKFSSDSTHPYIGWVHVSIRKEINTIVNTFS